MYEELASALRGFLSPTQIMTEEPMARHTTFHIGGAADIFALPGSVGELIKCLRAAKEHDAPVTIMGNGSNVLVRDKGIRGLVISFGAPFSFIRLDGTKITAGAGAILGAVSQFAAKHALGGLEFAVGIPGSLGGAVFMNAGAYGGEMSDVVRAVTALTPEGEVLRLEAGEMDFGYRHSVFQENGNIICEIELSLSQGDAEAIRAAMADFTGRRLDKQPIDRPSAGSTFKRPPGHFAGTLIEQTGLKGFSVGGAQVSEKHAGFVINTGGATAADVLALIEEVRRRVREAHGVTLVPEVRVLGEE